MLLDSSYIIPTGAGLPLNLTAQAWSILSVETKSMIDAGNFRANSELKLQGKLQPRYDTFSLSHACTYTQYL